MRVVITNYKSACTIVCAGILWERKYHRKTLVLGSLFNKVAGLPNLLKETPSQVFSCKICKIFKNTYCEEQLRMTASDFNMLSM